MAVSFAGPGPAAAHGAQRFVTSHLDAQPSNLGRGGGTTDTDTLALLLQAGATCLAMSCVVGYRLYRHLRSRPQNAHSSADEQLAAARAELRDKEQQLVALSAQLAGRRFSTDHSREIMCLHAKLRAAQEELVAAGSKCKAASERVARTACDLAVTEAELRAHRAQLQSATQQLQQLQSRLEDTHGELNLTRSQNLMMEREVAQLRRQLRDAAGQLEGHLAARAARATGLLDLDY
ncbi:hypothetical protein CHLRE_03g143807v5 [Chlamydomonas reinhardtii]|uniref:Uncharacterized protein n=1 Tax=Chlamydomonas reinhardtii TaxID=3055 RepID=A0A2K3DV03_CHLRE|nr:uncharacterized protein CHLRE_03g143807v5 [Chlamydomonas reinhardtii]PNW84377.1 hypothetical protein CHLRE_03g143807v5 [Chlamydomonas reinhardtii]